ncbi:MAG: single-stranded-DNA-specific exonuclease RecJ [Oscillospiraceae bacterium]|nr:single-stranded-DNA-specific exonuclease RecJ [Oscillospiraceae bacterium]
MSESVWKIPYQQPDCRALEQAGVPPLVAALLASRGISAPETALALLYTGPDSLHDPLDILGMVSARDRILRAIEGKEQVAVFGDYDVDGITSTCLLTEYLRSRGVPCSWYIPDRDSEGYGLNCAALRKLQEAGTDLVVTVDCGITAVEEAACARELGLDLVITDHHECKDGLIPDACAVIDPKQPADCYPNPELAGVGVAFKLVCACHGNSEEILERYADLVAVGTVADVMPLTGENRYLVQRGLKKLEDNPRPGFAAMIREAGCSQKKPSSSFIGYTMAPRLNAAGRLGCTAKAEELMLTQDTVEAERLASELSDLNRQRQKIENEIWHDARDKLKGISPDGPIVLAADSWHQGVIGIAASRLAEQFCVPTVMICLNGEKGKGSCRSYGNFNLYQALSACSDTLEGFGGHALAAGLNIRRNAIDRFREALGAYYRAHLPEAQPDVCCDLLLCDSSLLSLEDVSALDLLEPYGSANPKPVFCISAVRLLSAYGVGSDKQHLKFRIEFDGSSFDGIFFSHRKETLAVRPGDLIDLAFTPQINEYMGTQSVQLTAIAMRPHSPDALCERILERDATALWAAARYRPDRSDFVRLWKLFGSDLHVSSCLQEVLDLCPPGMLPERFCLCLAVFSEAGLLQSPDGRIYSSSFEKPSEKADLNATPIMKTLQAQ